LTFHHFDPPWRDEHHHNPRGMIALCLEHAAHADGDAFSKDELRSLKKSGPTVGTVIGHFPWAKREFLIRLGGCYFCSTGDVRRTVLTLDTTPKIALRRLGRSSSDFV
jgi:hypothetical protein